MGTLDIRQSIVCYLLFVLSISIHEFSHAFVAYLFGDSTAKTYGRMTLNPLAHLDLIGTVLIPLTMMIVPCNIAIVGWGRPVPVDIRNFKYRTIGDICTNLAGPFSNLIVATFLMIINCSPWFCHNNVVRHLLAIAACMNISLAIFNLLPLPPLDGSCLLKYVTNMSEEAFLMISQWSYIIMLVLINLPQFRHLLFNAINYTFYGIGYLSCKIVGTTEDMLFSFIK